MLNAGTWLLAKSDSKKYTDESMSGAGAVAGKNCTISNIVKADGVTTVTFQWTLDDGTVKTDTMIIRDGVDGVDGESAYEIAQRLGYSGTEEEWLASLVGATGEKGDKGVGIESITKQSTAGLVDTYLIMFADGTTTTFDVVNGANITKTSQLVNDSEFITNATIGLINYYLKDEVYSKAKIDELLRNIGAGLAVKIVSSLPTEEISGTTIYLINSSGTNYNQYMYIDGEWASLGSTSVDLSSYYNKVQIDTMLLGYVNASTLLTQLMAYTKTVDLAKVAKSNDYNDLDNLPNIPDVSGIKPYASELQDSENTAPTSKVVYDAVQGLFEALKNKLEESDLESYAKTEDVEEIVGDLTKLTTTDKTSVVAAVNEVNVNLDEKITKYDGEINADADANDYVETAIYRVNSWNDSLSNFPYGWGVFKIVKSDAYIEQIFSTSDNRRFFRVKDGNTSWSAWQEFATMDKLNKIPLLADQSTDILAYALTCPMAKRTLVRIHSANATNNPFGVLTDTDFIYEISKIDDVNAWISVKAKDVRSNREFLNTNNNGVWLGWSELITRDYLADVLVSANNSVTDLNEHKGQEGKQHYYVYANSLCANIPVQDGDDFQVEIIAKYDNSCIQVAYKLDNTGKTTTGSIYTRSVQKNRTTEEWVWTEWKKLNTSKEIQSTVMNVTEGGDYNITDIVGVPVSDVISMVGFGNTSVYDFCIIDARTTQFAIRILKGSGDVRINYRLA